MMEIDIYTTLVWLGIIQLIQVFVFIFQYFVNRNLVGPGWWLLWSLSGLVAFTLAILRKQPSLFPVSIILQDPILFAGLVFILIGLLRFFGTAVAWRWLILYYSSFVLLHLFFYLVVDNISVRGFLLDLYTALLSFYIVYSIIKNKTGSIAVVANYNAFLFSVHGCLFLWRTIWIAIGIDVSDIFASTFFNVIQYSEIVVISILWTFGLLLMINQRLNSEIKEAKTHFEKIFSMSPDLKIIIRLTDDSRVVCNDKFLKVMGYTKEEVIGSTYRDFRIWADLKDRKEIIRRAQEEGSCENFETWCRKKNGDSFTVLVSAVVLYLNEVPHLIINARDITERKNAELEIRLRNEKLRKVNAEKDKFFSIIAHDLRSPFSAFLGLTEIMTSRLAGMTKTEIQKFVSVMRDSAVNLFKLLENMLDWARMEKGEIPFNPEVHSLQELVVESVKVHQEAAALKSITVSILVADELEVYADKNMLQTVVRNLCSNAIKYTPRGGSICISADTQNHSGVAIAINDTGIGMSEYEVSSLFRIDAKSNRPGTEGESSTGIGLILCKAFIDKHSGKIWVESKEGEGSTFYCLIPHKSA
jgi:PAS domain S-box-containing protein